MRDRQLSRAGEKKIPHTCTSDELRAGHTVAACRLHGLITIAARAGARASGLRIVRARDGFNWLRSTIKLANRRTQGRTEFSLLPHHRCQPVLAAKRYEAS